MVGLNFPPPAGLYVSYDGPAAAGGGLLTDGVSVGNAGSGETTVLPIAMSAQLMKFS